MQRNGKYMLLDNLPNASLFTTENCCRAPNIEGFFKLKVLSSPYPWRDNSQYQFKYFNYRELTISMYSSVRSSVHSLCLKSSGIMDSFIWELHLGDASAGALIWTNILQIDTSYILHLSVIHLYPEIGKEGIIKRRRSMGNDHYWL